MSTTLVKYDRRLLSVFCALLLFLALLHLPIGYYRFLRVVVFIGALLVIRRCWNKNTDWVVVFIGIAVLFNPIFPIYLYKRSIWMPLDIIAGILFLIEGFFKKKRQETPEIHIPKKEEKTYGRDRIL